ncbi:hypothetical protein [Microbulbifer epialgicus]|uniref:Uncharacterized protein n=1 Tax=Microbulbifer epialgicus TaxID=393907 RepID=A0ABV4P2L2_9GAMM
MASQNVLTTIEITIPTFVTAALTHHSCGGTDKNKIEYIVGLSSPQVVTLAIDKNLTAEKCARSLGEALRTYYPSYLVHIKGSTISIVRPRGSDLDITENSLQKKKRLGNSNSNTWHRWPSLDDRSVYGKYYKRGVSNRFIRTYIP